MSPAAGGEGRFAGRVAVVTGAASGIGRATVRRLAAEGAWVLGADLDRAGLAATEASVRDEGGRVRVHPTDVTRPADCRDAVGVALAEQGRLDVLVNCAGVNRFSRFTDVSEEDWALVLGVNLTGTFHCCQAAIPALLETSGNIVNLASVAGLVGQAYTVAYTASKGGVVQLTRSLAMEYVRSGIRVNAVAPGGVDTPMNVDIAFPEDTDWTLVQPYMGFRGLAEADDVAGVVAFVASDEARWIHGAVVSCDGGVSAG